MTWSTYVFPLKQPVSDSDTFSQRSREGARQLNPEDLEFNSTDELLRADVKLMEAIS